MVKELVNEWKDRVARTFFYRIIGVCFFFAHPLTNEITCQQDHNFLCHVHYMSYTERQ